jgi:dipeptidyl aminopeptidase/acylaminoacyl peptidase
MVERRRASRGLALGAAVLLGTGLLVLGGTGTAGATNPGGRGLIAFESTRHGTPDIFVKASDGTREQRLTSHGKSEIDPAWSPNGRRLAYSGDETAEGHQNIWVMNADGTGKTLLTQGPQATGAGAAGTEPSWSPDGRRIVYNNYGELWVMNADGSGKLRIVNGSTEVGAAPAWSPTGSRIAFISGFDVWTMAPDGSARTRITTTTAAEKAVDWSPDGSALVYERGGQIWRMNADGTGQVPLMGAGEGGVLPAWSPDGSQIVFGSNAYGSTTGYEVMVMRADGTGEAVVPPPAAGADTDPSWQPVAVAAPAAPTGVIAKAAPTSAPSAAVTPQPDTSAPTVATRTPAANATVVTLGTNATATFGEPVQGVGGTTFTLRNAAGVAVGAAVTYDATTRVATLNPTADLTADTRYTATLTGGTGAIRDLAGNPLATTSWTFTTA